ncbi:MAG: sugar ABC transporter substrate-binding protein [Oscillospiraceae bacterium]|nr:sugar ABC transporter substrate-binding protein [Oscillospiraceae bacterium]
MSRRKRLLEVIGIMIVIASVLLFTACGTSQNVQQNASITDGQVAATQASTQETSAGASDNNTITINFLADPSLPFDKLNPLIPQFEQANNVKVNSINLMETNLRAKTVLELSSPSTDISVYMMDFTLMPTYIKAGYLEPLDQYLKDIPSFNEDDYAKPFLDSCRGEDGMIYGIPMYHACSVLVYRADIFQKHGLSVPKSYTDLENVLEILKEKEPTMSGIVMRGQRGYGVNEFIFPSFLQGFGGSYFKADGVTPNLDTPEAIEAARFYAHILREYGPSGIANYSHAEVQNDMLMGQTCMFIDSANLAIRCEDPEASQVAGKLGYAVVPGNVTQQPGFYTWAWSIASNAQNKDVAAKFAAWMMSPEIAGQIDLSAPIQTFDIVYNAPAYADYAESRPEKEVILESLSLSDPDYRPRIEQADEVGTRVSIAIQEIITGDKTAEEAMKEANADIVRIMNEN